MEIRRSLRADCRPERLFAWVEDLAVYPQWMRLVHAVDPVDSTSEGVPAWNVELQAQIGPFARSKRLRMVRSVHRFPTEVVFERAEVDGKAHSPWTLRAVIEPAVDDAQESGTGLTMELHYGGSLWTGAVLQRVLDEEVRHGSEALIGLVNREPTR